jgi:uncharacterized membrane protein YczE
MPFGTDQRVNNRSLVARWAQLLTGLLAFAVAIALMIRSGLGLGPWDAFHVGLHLLTGVSIGVASILTGILVVGISIAIGGKPGPATVANMVLVGLFTDLVLGVMAPAPAWPIGLGYHLAGIALMGLATGMYISPGLGAGPRDGLMAALSLRYGWSIQRTRTLIELSVLALGWLMGGKLGVGTILFAVAIGPSVQWGMRLFGLVKRDGSAAPAAATVDVPTPPEAIPTVAMPDPPVTPVSAVIPDRSSM